MAQDEDFKVVDKRHSATDVKEEAPKEAPKKGEGFTMKEGNEPPAPHQIDFATFIFSLATGALINMGLAPDPMTQKKSKNIELAKQNIELLALLQQKTKGNLTSEEQQLMESLLTEVRLRFVDASK